MQLVTFIGKKILYLLLLLVAVSFITFTLVSISPIDPVRAYIGADMLIISSEQRAAIEDYWGLNEPMFVQYFHWLASIISGDLGVSLIYRIPVKDIIADRFISSFLLMGIAWVLAGIIGILLGVFAAMKKETWIDRVIRGYCYILLSTPGFWLGLILLMIFAVWLGILPVGLSAPIGDLSYEVSFFDRLYHAILPALTLSIIGIANVCLHTREKLLDVLEQPFIKQARANGLKGLKLFSRHGVRNMILPAISVHFASFGELFGGAILAEQVFSYPGLGQAIVNAGLNGDIPLLLGVVIISACFVFLGNFLADMLYTVVDPRLRQRKGESRL
ncbi:peptide/nickel transport system permease protein [Gracilibacillus ureilyticus]|uniref:Peptide/nickel transport system permease protein n=1 Tax=Gracilibacillus ureilyticus TaxID=531814 RepID=A0A1H9PJE2_9BACI|nr:ABC transporter permease [Gracilibacillus ureilyticus]SER47965.1 peptide/nickel transport system permease protein [Gracilibacillus ureilyticus]